MKLQSAIRQLLGTPKDRDDIMDKASVVYQINCKDCEATYVGQTGRHLKERISEHRKAVEYGNILHSSVAEHAFEAHHEVDFDNIQVLDVENNMRRRQIREALRMRTTRPAMNRERGCDDPLPFLRLMQGTNHTGGSGHKSQQ